MINKDERDEHGFLTDMALAVESLEDNGCDCGTDEPGTCLACRCEAALKSERARGDEIGAANERLIQQILQVEEERDNAVRKVDRLQTLMRAAILESRSMMAFSSEFFDEAEETNKP